MESFGNIVAAHAKRMLSRLECKAVFCFFSAVCCASFLGECASYQDYDVNALPSAALGWIGHYASNAVFALPVCLVFLFPLLAGAVYSDSVTVDAQHGAATPLALRTTRGRYVGATALCAFLGALLLFVIPLAISQLLSFALFPLESAEFGVKMDLYAVLDMPLDASGYLLSEMWLSAPYLYNLIFIFYVGFFAGALALATLALSLYVPWGRIKVLGLPWLIWLVAMLALPAGLQPGSFLLPSPYGVAPILAVWLLTPIVIALVSAVAIWQATKHRDVFL